MGEVIQLVNGVWMKAMAEVVFRIDATHHHFKAQALIARVQDVSTVLTAGDKWSIEIHPEPLAKLLIVRLGPPDPADRRLMQHFFFDTIAGLLPSVFFIHMQHPGCIAHQNI